MSFHMSAGSPPGLHVVLDVDVSNLIERQALFVKHLEGRAVTG